MASIPPQRLTVDKIVKDLLEPATTSFYQVTIEDPRQLNERGDSFGTYLRQQGLGNLLNARGLRSNKKRETTIVLLRNNITRFSDINSRT